MVITIEYLNFITSVIYRKANDGVLALFKLLQNYYYFQILYSRIDGKPNII